MAVKKPKQRYSTAMLIDDSEIDNFINMKMLEGCNFADRVYVHTNGKSAIEFLRNIERTGEKDISLFPEVIFLDLNMPIMDGFQFADEFDKMPEFFKARTKIVVLTTSLNARDIERSKKYPQIIKYVNKPLLQSVLELI